MAAPSRVAARQATALEEISAKIDELLERIDAIEKMLQKPAAVSASTPKTTVSRKAGKK